MNISPGEVDTSAPLFSQNNGELVVDRSEAGLSSNSKGAPTSRVELKKAVEQTGELSAKLPPSLGLQKDAKDSDKQTLTIPKQSGDSQKEKYGDDLHKADPDPSTSTDVATKPEPKKRRARKKWKKPKDKPNRPLSAYNLFFQMQRAEMVGDSAAGEVDKTKKRVHRKTHGKVGFADMARSIGAKWKNLPPEEKKPFEEQAAKEKKRYQSELDTWKKEQKRKAIANRKSNSSIKGSSSLPARDSSCATSQRPTFSGDSNVPLGQQRLSGMDPGLVQQQQQQQQQYPRAAEASANALLHQFQQGGMPGMAQQNAAQVQAQAQILELQQQQLVLQHQQQRLVELQRQMNMNTSQQNRQMNMNTSQQNQGNLDTSNIQPRMPQAPMQQSTGGGESGQQGLGIQQQQQQQRFQFGGGQAMNMEQMNQAPFQPQFTGNMAAAMMRLQRRYGM